MPSKAPAQETVEQHEREQAMSVLVGLAGDTVTASKVLEDQYAIFVTPDALTAWRNGECRALYENLQERYAGQLEDALVREAREVAGRAMVLERRLLDETEKQLASGRMGDPSRAAANVSKVKDTAINKLLALTGRPSAITQSQDAAQIIRALEGKGVLVPIEAPIDAEVVE